MVIKRSPLEHNIATMARFCRDRGVDLAPHGKTTMAPSIWQRQLAAGAWGITVATPGQVAVCRRAGVPRVLLANELVDATTIAWLLSELDADSGFEFLCYVDSVAGVELLATALAAHASGAGAPGPGARPLDLLVEMGFADGRTGCRTVDQAVDVARAAAAVPGLRVVGTAGFEGGIGADLTPAVFVAVDDFLGRIHAAAAELLARNLMTDPGGGVIVSAGGSIFFDRAAEILTRPLPGGRRPHCVLRSGCYVTHDSGLYARMSPFSRPGADPAYTLVPALEAWGEVLSSPEPGLALVGIGRRDVPFDLGLPVPRLLRSVGGKGEARDVSGSSVRALNDQHAFVELATGIVAKPGDWLSFGISHPCTAFDKWRLLPLIDDDDHVIDFVETQF
jgi:D-serine deaminase-like pyridoxal phosphate-dependent protein